jgi:hypothetical protein
VEGGQDVFALSRDFNVRLDGAEIRLLAHVDGDLGVAATRVCGHHRRPTTAAVALRDLAQLLNLAVAVGDGTVTRRAGRHADLYGEDAPRAHRRREISE